ncbi:hypothetical protein Tco_0059813 [Tanacetum coccineum]
MKKQLNLKPKRNRPSRRRLKKLPLRKRMRKKTIINPIKKQLKLKQERKRSSRRRLKKLPLRKWLRKKPRKKPIKKRLKLKQKRKRPSEATERIAICPSRKSVEKSKTKEERIRTGKEEKDGIQKIEKQEQDKKRKEEEIQRLAQENQQGDLDEMMEMRIKVSDEAVHKELGDRMEKAATTASSLEAKQDSAYVDAVELLLLGSVNAVRHMLMLPVQVPAAEVAFLEKPVESDGFAEIIDFLNASSVHYALTVNPIIYTSSIEQFWATAKVHTVNGVRQVQALVDKKRVIIMESSIQSDLHLEDAGGTDCLPTATIFEELARMGYEKPSQKLTFYKAFFSQQWKFFIHAITQCLSAKSTAWNEFNNGGVKFLMYPRFLQVIINQQLGDMSHHKKIYVNPSHTKKIFANMKREGNYFSGRITSLFETMMVQPTQAVGVDLGIPTDSNQTPITTQPSSSRSQKKQSRRKQRKDTKVTQEETQQDDSVPTPSNDPPLSGVDSMQLFELMILCTNLQNQVLDLEKAKDAQAKEIADLKKMVQRLERKKKSRTTGLRRLKKVGMSRRVKSSKDQESLVDDTQGRSDDADMSDIDDLHGDEINVDTPVGENQEQSVKEREVDTSVEGSAALTTIEEISLAQTLIQIKVAKPKVVTTSATTTTTTRPKARGVIVQEPSEFQTSQESQPSITKDKGKAIMIKHEVLLKRKDQVALDEDLARNLQAQLEAELIEEEKLAKKQEEEANIALIESWDNIQAMMEADFKLAQKLQTEEQGEITIEERSRLFIELMNKRKKHFAMLRAEEKRRNPLTKAQNRNQMRVNTFIPMDSKEVKSKKETEESSKGTKDELKSDKSKKADSSEEKAKVSKKKMLGRKRAGKEQQQESSKKQRMEDDKETYEVEEVEEVDEGELKKNLVIVKDDDIAIDAIPLATKPPVIVEYMLLNKRLFGEQEYV